MSGFGLYVHWPYCARKCPYCDFNSHVRSDRDEAGWLNAVLKEMALVAKMQGKVRPELQSVFFGGGTPSLMQGKSAGRILEEAARFWPCAKDLEVTLEANPASAEAARFADYAAAGVNRLSLGVQSFDDAALKFLARLHNAAEAKAALALAIETFPRVSFDLIYARPGQTAAAWEKELSEALAYGTEHLSLYQLTIEPVTPFATMQARGLFQMPEEETAAALYETTQSLTEAAGLPAYEISNHARPGCEARHNLLYWRYGAYAGVGPGAHGRLDLFGRRYATYCERLPERWQEKVEKRGHGFATVDEIEPDVASREHLLMNLRLREGLNVADYQARWGKALSVEKIAALAADGFISYEAGHLAATPRGFLVLNRLIDELAVF
jgi:putative oxygen-independent coproporphyrinogen III oxidase